MNTVTDAARLEYFTTTWYYPAVFCGVCVVCEVAPEACRCAFREQLRKEKEEFKKRAEEKQREIERYAEQLVLTLAGQIEEDPVH